MGFGTYLISPIYFSKETYQSRYQVEKDLKNVRNSIADYKATLKSLVLITEPQKFCPKDENPHRLNGEKHLIIGNHDGSCRTLSNYFESVSHIKEVTFKKAFFPFLEENMHCIMCHFPMVAWNRRMSGSVMLHGHTHGSICEFNKKSEELRLDIGFDSEIGNCDLVELEDIYNYFKTNVTNDKTFKEHINCLVEKTGLRG